MEAGSAYTFAELFKKQCQERPEHIAVVSPGENLALTFTSLSSRVDVLTQLLASEGVQAQDRVAVCLGNVVAFVECFLALSRLKAIAIPIDTSYSPPEIETIPSDSGASFFLLREEHTAPFAQRTYQSLGHGTLLLGRCEGDDLPEGLDDVVMMKYTSGSTGTPKGVLLTALNMAAEGQHVVSTLQLTADDKSLAVIPLYHSYGFDFCFMPMLTTGCTLVLLQSFHARSVLRALQTQAITLFPAVPFMFDLLTRIDLSGQSVDFSSLRYCISAAAPLSARTVRRFYDAFDVVIGQNYGSSEGGAISLEIRRKPGVPSTCLGKPLHGVDIHILDDDGNPVPQGEVGEVVVGGEQVSSHGYYRDPALSAKAFRAGLCFTGDLGRLDEEGRLFLSRRKKNVINFAGKKIVPQEVEAVLETLDGVQEVVVVGVEDEVSGELVKACIVASKTFTTEELVSFCQGKLAGHKIPQRWQFYTTLPRSSVGKLDMSRLKV